MKKKKVKKRENSANSLKIQMVSQFFKKTYFYWDRTQLFGEFELLISKKMANFMANKILNLKNISLPICFQVVSKQNFLVPMMKLTFDDHETLINGIDYGNPSGMKSMET